jgi:hypothetical protein
MPKPHGFLLNRRGKIAYPYAMAWNAEKLYAPAVFRV